MPPRLRMVSCRVLGLFFVVAGLNHFVLTDFYLAIMPPWLPWHRELVWLSGLAELGLGALVLWPPARRLAGWGLIALCVAVFPANLHMALHPELFAQFPPLALWARLPLQAVAIAWIAWSTLNPPQPNGARR